MQNTDGLNLPLARDGESASQGAAAAGSTEGQCGAPDREHTGVPAETSGPRRSEYLPNVSHRIRTPLHAIMGLAESLSETELSMEQRTMVRLLRTSADSLLGAVDNLFDFSLLETGQIKLEIGRASCRERV